MSTDLAELLGTQETATLEFKREATDRNAIGAAICALANGQCGRGGGGVGKTPLTYHLAHMLQRLGRRVLAVDLDPQSNLTAAFLDEDVLGELWQEFPAREGNCQRTTFSFLPEESGTVVTAIRPIMEGIGDIEDVQPVMIAPDLWLLPGDLDLSAFEDRLCDAWPRGFTGKDPAAVRVTTAFHRTICRAAENVGAEIVLIDVGPNLGAMAAFLADDAVLMPLAADLFSLRALRNLGPALREWRRLWREAVLPKFPHTIEAPRGTMSPLGYVVMHPAMRLDRPVWAYQRWLERIPEVFATAVLDQPGAATIGRTYEIATLRNYQSLVPLAHDAWKPMFDLRSADSALGSTQVLVQRCHQDFKALSENLMSGLKVLAGDDK